MDNLIFAINASMPIFLIILLGWVLMRIGLLTAAFTTVADQLVFKVALPILLFYDISTIELQQEFNISFVLFCMGATTAMFFGVWVLARVFVHDKSIVGAFTQASVRGSATILGVAFVQNIYGNAGITPIMIATAVPLFNVYSVLILSFSAQQDSSKGRIRQVLLHIVTNPIIIGILLGMPFAIFQFELPIMLSKTVSSLAETATPLALLVVGAGFKGSEAIKKLKPTLAATVIKLFVLPAVFLPIAVAFGIEGMELVAVLVMVGAPTAVSSYIMAKDMHNDEVLTSSVITLTTLFSSVSFTIWIFVLRQFSLM
jgi:predicted permease